MIVAFTGMVELNLYQVCGVGVAWHIGQPVVSIQLTILSAYSIFA
jgi:hypothetical protein